MPSRIHNADPPVLVKPFSFQERLKEIGMFFQGTDPVHQTMNRIAKELERAQINYAVVGGMAVNAHGHPRTTDDVDFLLTAEGFEEFCRRFIPSTYQRVPRRRKRFVDPANGVTFVILVTGRFPGTGEPGPIAYPDPAAVRTKIEELQVINLATLIQLKLAARRYQDLADVVNLIRVHHLDASFQVQLHPSVHRDYIECLEEMRREVEYEERQDRILGEDDSEKKYDEEENDSG